MRWLLRSAVLVIACGGSAAGVPAVDSGALLDAGALPARDAGLSTGFDAGPSLPRDGGQTDGGAISMDAGVGYSNATKPDELGPYSLSTVSATVTNGSRRTPLVAHLPTGLQAAPVVVFLPGANLTTAMYLPTVERLASHGFVVVRADPVFSLFSVDHVAMMNDTRAAIDWALSPTGPLAGRVDSSRVAVMGHSLGGKLAIMTAFADMRVRAVFGTDPVNAQSPNVVPTQVAPLAIALGIAGETTDATGSFGMACAPAAGNYTTFFDAATSSPWAAEWTFAGINHLDFVDACSGLTCGLCNRATGDKPKARADLHTLVVAFFRKHFRGDSRVDAWLTGASVPAEITTRHR